MFFSENEIKVAVSEFWKRQGHDKVAIKQIPDGLQIGSEFSCLCDTHGKFHLYDFYLKKINRFGKLIVSRK